MNTSFYFFLWISLTYTIVIFGNPWLQNNAFFITFALVYLFSMGSRNMLARQFRYQRYRDRMAFYEIRYTNNIARIRRSTLNSTMFQAVTTLYLFAASVILTFVGESFVIVAIFAGIGLLVGRNTYRLYGLYRLLCKTDHVWSPTDNYEDYEYQEYCLQRKDKTPAEICTPPSRGDKALRIVNYAGAIASIVMGLAMMMFFGFMALFNGHLGAVLNAFYGGLALAVGINDLATVVRGYTDLIR